MLVTNVDFFDCLNEISKHKEIAVDTETTGLEPYKDSRLFSVIMTTSEKSYYFNFNEEADHLGNYSASLGSVRPLLDIISTRDLLYFANAKFDMAMLEKEGPVEWKAEIHDVLVMDRLVHNDHMKYSLDAVAKRHGFEKSDAVEEYITEHKLWNWVKIPGKKGRVKNKYYNKVPLNIIAPYGLTDGHITFQIGKIQREKLKDYFQTPWPSPMKPDEIERKITKILYRMEKEGIDVDERECTERADQHTKIFDDIARRFHDQTRSVLIDSAKVLGPLFVATGNIPPKTEKENDSITDEWLTRINTPLAKLVVDYRTHSKLANTFYRNYLWHLTPEKKIHANINQGGTATGRLSYSSPNLQQTPDSEVRKVFIPPKDYCLVSIDWDQQEYKMMLDYAEQMDLIDQIKNGHDVHTATAQLVGIDRKPAKTLNFMLLYGGGTVKLALALFPVTASEAQLWLMWKVYNGWKLDAEDRKWENTITTELESHNMPILLEAEALRDKYFSKLPKVQELIALCKQTAKDRGFIRTWTGRRLHFKKQFSYKAPNALIQGGASDVAKLSMIGIDKQLERRKSKLLVQIHDEMIFKIHRSELAIVPELKNVMETTFPARHLGLSTSVDHSWKNLYDLRKGFPSEETRNQVQGEGV